MITCHRSVLVHFPPDYRRSLLVKVFQTSTMKASVFGLWLIATLVPAISATLDRHCLDCICEASTGCKPNIRCHNTGTGQYYCGPYQISWAYWADGGKPGNNGFANDFETCLVDRSCAEKAVQGYMAKWGTDCNGDGRVDCLDYAAIHKAGRTGCNQQWLLNSKYWNQFNQCYRKPVTRYNPAASAAAAITSTFPAGRFNPINTIIEIPKPIYNRPSIRSSPVFTPPSIVSESYSSSYSHENFSHTETEVVSSGVFANNPSLPPPLPSIPNIFNNKPLFTQPLNLNPPRISNNFPPLPSRISLPEIKPLIQPVVQPAAAVAQPVSIAQPVTVTRTVTHTSVTSSSPAINFDPVVPEDCLHCLCMASTKCDLKKGCEGAYCGPYLLSWGYWADGGQPQKDYPSCATNKQCSEQAINGYMNKWKRDCNGDGRIDCTDFALIHKLGPHGCGKLQALESTDYWKQFETCQRPSIIEQPEDPPVSHEERPNLEPAIGAGVSGSASFPRRPSIPAIPSQPNIVEAPSAAVDNNNRVAIDFSPPEIPPLRSQPDAGSVRITFNDRDIVNTFPTPQPRIEPEVRPVERFDIPQPNPNLNSVNPASSFRSVPVNHRPEPSELKPLYKPEPIRNEEYFTAPRPAEPSSGDIYNEALSSGSLEPVRPVSTVSELPTARATRPRTSNNSSVVPQECLECICHASSKCSSSIGCVNDGSGKFICGPYQVDWEYWTEAGKPGNRADLSNLENFQMCLNSRECADETVRAYLTKHRKDCNEDGRIDCNDYAALHIAGPNNCNAQWYLDSKYYSDFRECFDF